MAVRGLYTNKCIYIITEVLCKRQLPLMIILCRMQCPIFKFGVASQKRSSDTLCTNGKLLESNLLSMAAFRIPREWSAIVISGIHTELQILVIR